MFFEYIDYQKVVRNLVILGCLVILPLFLVFMQCCDQNKEVTAVLSARPIISDTAHTPRRVVRNGTNSNITKIAEYDNLPLVGAYRPPKDLSSMVADPESVPGRKQKSTSHVITNTKDIKSTNSEPDYSDIDYKILHHLDIEEHESGLYYKRKAYLNSLKPTTTPRPTNPNDPVNCQLLTSGEEIEIKRVTQKLLKRIPRYETASELIDMAKDCPKYIKDRGYVTSVLSEIEEGFPLAFGIRLHDRAAQAEKLLRTIYRPNNVYCIYVDKKSPERLHEAMKKISDCFPNVFIASKLESYVYTSFSPVKADLQCMTDVLNSNVNWKYFLNLAGTEFPLKTNREIVEILTVLNGTNDIEQYPFPENFYHRFGWRHLVYNDRLINTQEYKEPFSEPIKLLKGCSYNTYSRPFVEWVLKDNLAQRFINWTRDMDSPDELIWATLNNLPHAPGGYEASVTQTAKTFLSREVIWRSSASYCTGQRFVHGICIMSSGDLNWLSHRWEIFANKFDISYDPYVLDCLEQSINNRTLNPDINKNIPWYGIYRAPHVKVKPDAERAKRMA